MVRPVPWTVEASFWLLICVAGIDLVTLIVNLIEFNWQGYLAKSVHAFRHNGQLLQVTPSLAIGTVIASIVIDLLGVGVTVLFSFLLRRGMNWVRILLTVRCGIALIGVFGRDLESYLITAATIVAVVFLWLPGSSEFFRTVKSDRSLYKSQQRV